MNIKDIALLAETSVATVSRVINLDERVAEKTRQRVLEVMESTGYKPELVGRALLGQQKGKILVLLPTMANPLFARVLAGVEHRASANGYDVLICNTHRDYDIEKRYLNMVRANQLDGAILLTAAASDEELDAFAALNPLVQCCSRSLGGHISYTCIDDEAAAFEATNYLIGLGNQRIGLINGNFDRKYEIEREKGYRRALESNKIKFLRQYLGESDYNLYDGYDACRRLMELEHPPTALFCSSDQLACGVMKYVMEHGKRPGVDVDIVGFDGTYIAELCTPSITSIEQPGYEMGKTSFDLLLERIQDKEAIVKRVVMAYKLVRRGSTKECAAE
ncbi:MAG: LacI family DNA-binding transcriptional regulator [Oscillospiraceae bacterium]|jgi:LacI family repressor for deo operon, udp, cdd, tsx, nupC, and nupG|nr:LacI family DNA-binding transcriptional regulator [Oscillospiraceae bacterium]